MGVITGRRWVYRGNGVLLPNLISQDLPVGLGWFLVFWVGLDELVNSLYWTLVPILDGGKCKRCEFASWCITVIDVGFRFESPLA